MRTVACDEDARDVDDDGNDEEELFEGDEEERATDMIEELIRRDELLEDDERDVRECWCTGTQTPKQSAPPSAGLQSSDKSSVHSNPS